jgi:hypothetical protein
LGLTDRQWVVTFEIQLELFNVTELNLVTVGDTGHLVFESLNKCQKVLSICLKKQLQLISLISFAFLALGNDESDQNYFGKYLVF